MKMFNKFNSYAFLQYLRAEMKEPGQGQKAVFITDNSEGKTMAVELINIPSGVVIFTRRDDRKITADSGKGCLR